MVIAILRLLRECDGAALPVFCRVGLNQGSHRFVNHVAVKSSKNLTAPNHRARKNSDGGDTAICDSAEVGRMLLVHDYLARHGEGARHALNEDGGDLNAGTLLVLRRNLDDVVRLRAAFGALVWLVLGRGGAL
ncbi:hypothetical protein GCM10022270_24820 [Terriglobus aquaticus]